jgi:hypothetical protein
VVVDKNPIGPLNSARIGEGTKPKKCPMFFPKKLVRSGKSMKMSISRGWVVVDKNQLVC